ncbi:MAG TPA: hypothetical protein PL151_17325 [Phycisphaerae bacterium]|nr:hypothetical protein [Phycisphaerae bacterium]HOJ76196.1 hypothetical protein [Phycisphaerae bacterium]HOM53591.1 hypothetical protein [Phycisphaerae bacterium]HON68425.1 hypothetical protein [Phycisphaerae bacterium]HOQ84564.1 hypothetical protein [Phycisphaerae bacterium]
MALLGLARTVRILLVASVAVFAGCDELIRPSGRSAEQEPVEFSTVRIPGVSIATVRPVAAEVFTEKFRLDRTASTGTLLISRPLEVSERADDEQAGVREVLSGAHGRRRQVARLQLVERGDSVLVRCAVQVQRLDVAERGAFVPQRGDDRPAAVQTDRVTGPQTLTEDDWVAVGRDRHAERMMLNEIAERLAGQTAAPPAATRPQ